MKKDLIIKKFGSIENFNALLESNFQLENFFSMGELISHLEEKGFIFKNIFLQRQKEYFYINMNRIIFLENRNIKKISENELIAQKETVMKMTELEFIDILYLMKENSDFFINKNIVFRIKHEKFLKVLTVYNKKINTLNFGFLSLNFSKENYICE